MVVAGALAFASFCLSSSALTTFNSCGGYKENVVLSNKLLSKTLLAKRNRKKSVFDKNALVFTRR